MERVSLSLSLTLVLVHRLNNHFDLPTTPSHHYYMSFVLLYCDPSCCPLTVPTVTIALGCYCLITPYDTLHFMSVCTYYARCFISVTLFDALCIQSHRAYVAEFYRLPPAQLPSTVLLTLTTTQAFISDCTLTYNTCLNSEP